MDVSRAKKNIKSKDHIAVEKDGVMIWIDSIDQEKKKATIHPVDYPDQTEVVSVSHLHEL